MIFLDTHVHIYPCYSIARVFEALFRNIETHRAHSQESSDPVLGAGIILTERNDCNFFEQLIIGNSLPAELKERYSIKDDLVSNKSNDTLLPVKIYPGRQVNSSEKVEVLALLHEPQLPENLPLNELIQLIANSGGVPVINWAPGKWLGYRGELVKNLIQSQPTELLLGITSLLPEYFPIPKLVSFGKDNGIHCVGGSDPLPFSSQEELCGKYGIALPTLKALPDNKTLKHLLMSKPHNFLGKRSSMTEVLYRLIRNEMVRRKVC